MLRQARWARKTWPVAVGVVAVVVAGCGVPNSPGPASGPANPVAPESIPAPQRAALSDGKVTLAEYQAAYAEFMSCVRAGGGHLEEIGRDASGIITYRVGGRLGAPDKPNLTSVEGRCYHDNFDSVEVAFELSLPGGSTPSP